MALSDLNRLMQSPSVHLLSETLRHAEFIDLLLRESKVIGNRMYDAHIAALCIEHGISELITADRDFTRFPIKMKNPFHP